MLLLVAATARADGGSISRTFKPASLYTQPPTRTFQKMALRLGLTAASAALRRSCTPATTQQPVARAVRSLSMTLPELDLHITAAATPAPAASATASRTFALEADAAISWDTPAVSYPDPDAFFGVEIGLLQDFPMKGAGSAARGPGKLAGCCASCRASGSTTDDRARWRALAAMEPNLLPLPPV